MAQNGGARHSSPTVAPRIATRSSSNTKQKQYTTTFDQSSKKDLNEEFQKAVSKLIDHQWLDREQETAIGLDTVSSILSGMSTSTKGALAVREAAKYLQVVVEYLQDSWEGMNRTIADRVVALVDQKIETVMEARQRDMHSVTDV